MTLGEHLGMEAGPLGKPCVDDVLALRSKGWARDPMPAEIVVVNDTTNLVHSLKPPRISGDQEDLVELWVSLQQQASRPTWCGCQLTSRAVTYLELWDREAMGERLCKRCFGRSSVAAATEMMADSSDTSSSSS